ncbi:MAG TPA: hypothetical protein VFD65_06400, partial [Chitinophagales bacterium]|nr:hypothetical protein [Chitinophagales bacterium]
LFLLANYNVQAKVYSTCPYPQHEVGIGYGYLSNDQLALSFLSSLGLGVLSSITDIKTNNESFTYIGPIHATYKFFAKERLSVGVSLIYAHTKLKYEDEDGDKMSLKFHAASVMPRFDFYYIRNPKFALYGNLGVGVMYGRGAFEGPKSVEQGVTLAFQVTPIAMRIGRDFGVVLEIGIGSLGVANAGVSYRNYDRPWGM